MAGESARFPLREREVQSQRLSGCHRGVLGFAEASTLRGDSVVADRDPVGAVNAGRAGGHGFGSADDAASNGYLGARGWDAVQRDRAFDLAGGGEVEVESSRRSA